MRVVMSASGVVYFVIASFERVVHSIEGVQTVDCKRASALLDNEVADACCIRTDDPCLFNWLRTPSSLDARMNVHDPDAVDVAALSVPAIAALRFVLRY